MHYIVLGAPFRCHLFLRWSKSISNATAVYYLPAKKNPTEKTSPRNVSTRYVSKNLLPKSYLCRETVDGIHKVLRQHRDEPRDDDQTDKSGAHLEVRSVLGGVDEQVRVGLELQRQTIWSYIRIAYVVRVIVEVQAVRVGGRVVVVVLSVHTLRERSPLVHAITWRLGRGGGVRGPDYFLTWKMRSWMYMTSRNTPENRETVSKSSMS